MKAPSAVSIKHFPEANRILDVLDWSCHPFVYPAVFSLDLLGIDPARYSAKISLGRLRDFGSKYEAGELNPIQLQVYHAS